MNNITTTSNLFGEPEDITHRPKRLQGENFKNTPLHIPSKSEQVSNTPVDSVPTFITLERALSFYESNSNSTTDIGKLYIATANWLKELLELRAAKVDVMAKQSMPNVGAKLVKSMIEQQLEKETE